MRSAIASDQVDESAQIARRQKLIYSSASFFRFPLVAWACTKLSEALRRNSKRRRTGNSNRLIGAHELLVAPLVSAVATSAAQQPPFSKRLRVLCASTRERLRRQSFQSHLRALADTDERRRPRPLHLSCDGPLRTGRPCGKLCAAVRPQRTVERPVTGLRRRSLGRWMHCVRELRSRRTTDEISICEHLCRFAQVNEQVSFRLVSSQRERQRDRERGEEFNLRLEMCA